MRSKKEVTFYRKIFLLELVGNWPNSQRYCFLDLCGTLNCVMTSIFVPSSSGSWPVSEHQSAWQAPERRREKENRARGEKEKVFLFPARPISLLPSPFLRLPRRLREHQQRCLVKLRIASPKSGQRFKSFDRLLPETCRRI